MHWILCRTKPLQEAYAAHNVGRQGLEYYLPRIIELVKGKPKVKVMFPSYLFVNVDTQWIFLKSTYGISTVVTRLGTPEPVPDKIINELKKSESKGVVILPKITDPRFETNAKLRLTAGLLEGMIGTFSGLSGRDRVKVLLKFMNQQMVTTVLRDDVTLYVE